MNTKPDTESSSDYATDYVRRHRDRLKRDRLKREAWYRALDREFPDGYEEEADGPPWT